MIVSLRRSHPEPMVYIQTETAKRLSIKEGDIVCLETRRGKIKLKSSLSAEIDPRVVFADYGWWFPERDAKDLHGWAESNLNILTNNKPPFAREMGSSTLRGIVCKVSKAKV